MELRDAIENRTNNKFFKKLVKQLEGYHKYLTVETKALYGDYRATKNPTILNDYAHNAIMELKSLGERIFEPGFIQDIIAGLMADPGLTWSSVIMKAAFIIIVSGGILLLEYIGYLIFG